MRNPTTNNINNAGSRSDNSGTTQNSVTAPGPIVLPKGGGAIKGISEKFSANPVTGTSSFSIPLPVSPARGFEPQLALNYNSGNGNSPYGLGWNLNLPSISRKTEKGLPQYLDSEDTDTFVLTGVEDLVPLLQQQAGEWRNPTAIKTLNNTDWEVRLYRPRIEAAFNKIERWRNPQNGVIWWRTTSGTNVSLVYGYHASARITDPKNPAKIFKWLPEYMYDDKGHLIQYVYKTEDLAGVDHSLAYEQHRMPDTVSQSYLKRILYGIKQPYWLLYENTPDVLEKPFQTGDFHFQTVFDYGEHTADEPDPKEVSPWPVRHDAFSDYRAGFEIRTYRRCHRVLSFHQFENELPSISEPVAEISFEYDDQNLAFSVLSAVVQTGYKRNTDARLSAKPLPAMTFGYQAHAWNSELKSIDSKSLQNLPAGVDGRNYQWVDLYNEGLSGVLTEQADGLYYKQNLGSAQFAQASLVAPAPSQHGLADGRLQIQDLESNGLKSLVSTAGPVTGYYQFDGKSQWHNFQPFQDMPNIDFRDPNLRIIDLNGDGKPDLLISEEQAFRWYPSTGKQGYGPASKTAKPQDEENGPAVVFANQSESIFQADMNGDGLADLVRIRNASIEYWPNLGYGQFGAKVTMANAPQFNHPDQFDPADIRLADLDGSGPTDIVYLGKNEFRYWLNLSGNSWSTPHASINPFPHVDNLANVSVMDLLGTGTACVVWSSPLSVHNEQSIRYVDVMDSTKPHLMTEYQNGMGKQVTFEYTASTHFYLEDAEKGQPWITRLHFPVHCLSKVESYDQVTKARFCSSYSYHHGYYDHAEREFRGFGRVDQIDSEDYEHFISSDATNVVERVLHQTPILTKTWFHCGNYLDRNHILSHYQQQYFSAPEINDIQLAEPELPDDLTTAEWREALRACKGMALRSETYALDGGELENIPYSISQNSCQIKRIQPKADSNYASFQVINSDTLNLQLDRNPEDPRISHELVLQTDDYGNPLLSASIGYARIFNDPDIPAEVFNEQAKTHIQITQSEYTDDAFGIFGEYRIDDSFDATYRLPVNWKISNFELNNATQPAASLYTAGEMLDYYSQAGLAEYHDTQADELNKRHLSQIEVRFLNDSLDGARNPGEPSPLGLTWCNYQLAFSPSLLPSIYGGKVDSGAMDGGYVDLNGDGHWWQPSGTPIYGNQVSQRFYTPDGSYDALGNPSWIDLDAYLLLPISSRDAKQNETLAINDYRALRPQFIRDPNHNWTGVEFDELGMVVRSAVMGKVESLNDGEPPPPDAVTQGDNLRYPSEELEYDFYDPQTNHPAYAYSKRYINHQTEDPSEQREDYVQQYEYFDGSGNVLMVKAQAEPGLAKRRNEDGSIEEVDTGDDVRWIGNGRTIVNNKGNPIKQYEPYFSVTHEYEDDPGLVEIGVTSILFYDQVGRNDCILLANHSYSKTVFNPWQQSTWDVNDTLYVLNDDGSINTDPASDPDVGHYFKGLAASEYLPSWYSARINGALGPEQQRAAQKTEAHAGTPALSYSDSLGRTVYAISDNAEHGQYSTRTTLDIEGNALEVIDHRENTVMAYGYNMLPPADEENPKPALYQQSMDGGETWTLFNVLGQPIRSWDSRGHVFENTYDELGRPVQSTVVEDGITKIVGLNEYYDSDSPQADTAWADNLIGIAYQAYDQAGLVETLTLDFKGNPTHTRRTFASEFKQTVDWNTTDRGALLQAEYFESVAEFDALSRVIHSLSPHNPDIPASETWPAYGESGRLNNVEVSIRGGERKSYVTNMDYDAKGQRQKIEYGNGVGTEYYYEPDTYRLQRLVTTRGANENLQDLNYFYDPAGNITEIRDNAQQDIFFNGQHVEPHSEYRYDPIYRLIEASGREHATQAFPDPYAGWQTQPHPNDGTAMQRYVQSYDYDGVGNILKMAHRAGGNGWTRHYQYAVDSNRLLATTLGDPAQPFNENYLYNNHGSMTGMPHLSQLDWDFAEQLKRVDLSGGGQVWHVYNAQGQRSRKIIETNGTTVKERIYLGGWELYRETVAGQLRLERETQHVMDDQRRIALIETKTLDTSDDSGFEPVVRYQLGNHLGSASLELDEQGNIISYEEYHPYGTTAYHAGTAVLEISPKRYRYTGKERDEETGFSYHDARYLAVWLGRWTAADPAGLVDTSNLYIYARNAPVNLIDLDGRQPEGWVDTGYGYLIEEAPPPRIARQLTPLEQAVHLSDIRSDLNLLYDPLNPPRGEVPTGRGYSLVFEDPPPPRQLSAAEEAAHLDRLRAQIQPTVITNQTTIGATGGDTIVPPEPPPSTTVDMDRDWVEAVTHEGEWGSKSDAPSKAGRTTAKGQTAIWDMSDDWPVVDDHPRVTDVDLPEGRNIKVIRGLFILTAAMAVVAYPYDASASEQGHYIAEQAVGSLPSPVNTAIGVYEGGKLLIESTISLGETMQAHGYGIFPHVELETVDQAIERLSKEQQEANIRSRCRVYPDEHFE